MITTVVWKLGLSVAVSPFTSEVKSRVKTIHNDLLSYHTGSPPFCLSAKVLCGDSRKGLREGGVGRGYYCCWCCCLPDQVCGHVHGMWYTRRCAVPTACMSAGVSRDISFVSWFHTALYCWTVTFCDQVYNRYLIKDHVWYFFDWAIAIFVRLLWTKNIKYDLFYERWKSVLKEMVMVVP